MSVRRPRAMRRLVATLGALAALALGLGPAPTAAQAAAVDLEAYVGTIEDAVPGAPTFLGFGVSNVGTAGATGVALTLHLPPGVEVVELVQGTAADCTVVPAGAGTDVECELPEVPTNYSIGEEVYLRFAATGSYPLTLDIVADQPEANGSSATSTAVVLDEEADLWGSSGSEPTRADVGDRVWVSLGFGNDGPTAAADATITGTFPAGATVVPGSFFYGYSVDESATACTVTAAGFTCRGAWADVLGVHQHVQYEVVTTTAGHIDATATISGRNDPDHSNDVATFPIDVRAPAAEIHLAITPPTSAWVGQQTREVVVGTTNVGELPAAAVAVRFTPPPGWTVGLPDDPVNADRTCVLGGGGTSITCTYGALAAVPVTAALWLPVTSPAGPPASGNATATATTPTPEHGDQPNTDTELFVHRSATAAPAVAVTPSTDVVDGSAVTVEVSDFPEFSSIAVTQCTAGGPPGVGACDLGTLALATTDILGGATVALGVNRFIATGAGGLVDCAVEACTVTAATFDLSTSASAPITVAEPAPADIAVSIGDAAYTDGDGRSNATVSAVLTCDEATTVALRFDLAQVDSPVVQARHGTSDVTVACTPGTPVDVSSDLIADMDPGPAEVAVRAYAGTDRAVVTGDVDLASGSEQLAVLLARLADPNDTTVIDELVAALLFRLEHNPAWALRFWQAILAPPT